MRVGLWERLKGLQLPELVLEGEGGGEGKVRARVTFFEVLGGASGALHVMRTSRPAALARRKSKVTLRSADAETRRGPSLAPHHPRRRRCCHPPA